jgi:hypothetical protein
MRSTKALSGAAQDAYFRRVLKAQGSLSQEAREQLVGSLKRDIAQLRLRREPLPDRLSAPSPISETRHPQSPASSAPAAASGAGTSFDPFSPNVVVLLRTQGRAAALAALAVIDSQEELRLLAREQRLSVALDLTSPAELRAAIVSAAERRIANRVAAAS